jgi:hypothetical protein
MNRDQPKNELGSAKMNQIQLEYSQNEPGSAEFGLRLGAFLNCKLKELIVMDLYLVSK